MNNAKKFDHRHSRAACVVGAFAPYNHGVLLAGESGNPVSKIIPTQRVDKTEVSFRYAEIFNQLDSRFRGNDGK